jgi:protein phosphatase
VTIVSSVETLTDRPAETLRLAVAAVTDAAGRDENQDVAAAIPVGRAADSSMGEDFLLVVADGMGGHPSGDVASQIALEVMTIAFPVLPDGDLGAALTQAYRRANEQVFQGGVDEPTRAGMGTTLTAALVHGKYATIANVGDSRGYLLRGGGLTQLTRDHTVVADEIASGRVSPEEARHDPRRNMLTHALGTNARLARDLPDIFEITLLPGDRLLLCSDGLYGVLDDADLRQTLAREDPAEAARALVALAAQRGTRDNASAVVAAAIPTRVPIPAALPATPSRTGGLPGTAIAAAVAILLIVLLVLAIFVLGAAR